MFALIRKDYVWIMIFALISVLVSGVLSNFRFDVIDIQLHDTYFVLHSIQLIVWLTVILWMSKCILSLVDAASERYMVVALVMLFILPLLTLPAVIALVLSIDRAMAIAIDVYHPQASGAWISVLVLSAFIMLLVVMAVRCFEKVRRLF